MMTMLWLLIMGLRDELDLECLMILKIPVVVVERQKGVVDSKRMRR
jgi:hypothetical protein